MIITDSYLQAVAVDVIDLIFWLVGRKLESVCELVELDPFTSLVVSIK
jgi:hypothetical protein